MWTLRRLALSFSLVVIGVGAVSAILNYFAGLSPSRVLAQSTSITVCPAGPPTCNHQTIQSAVDAAGEGDVIKIATGIYTDTFNPLVSITKSLTLRGGYASGFTEPPDFEGNPTLLDAQGGGPVIDILGGITVTIEGLQITGGG